MAPLGKIARITLGKMLQPIASSALDQETLYLRSASVTEQGTIDLDGAQTMWFSPRELVQLSLRAGDLVVVEGGSVGRSALIQEDLPDVGFQNSINRVTPRSGMDSRFVNYALIATRATGFFDVYCDSVSMKHLTAEKLGWLQIPFADYEDQRAIADFLDRETAQIDALVAAQRDLVALLEERRNAVIGSLVADPQSHWPRGCVARMGRVTLGKMLAPSETPSMSVEAPYLRAANVQPNGVLALDDIKTMWFSPSEFAQLTLRAGDVVVVEGGQGGFGRAAYLNDYIPGVAFQNSINRIRPFESSDGRYIAYSLIHARSTGFMRAYCDAVSMPHMTAEKLLRFPMQIPPKTEQVAIADHLDTATRQTDSMIEAANESIALMLERRSALISAAVTGRIDPRTGQETKEAS